MASRRAAIRLLQGAVLVSLAWGLGPEAAGVVVEGGVSAPRPADGYVGKWNGSSGVPVDTHWFLTAKHVGGAVGQNFLLQDTLYTAAEIVDHPTADLRLVRVEQEMPGHHEIASDPKIGDPAMVGGYGAIAGSSTGNGYRWSGTRAEAWGYNTVELLGSKVGIRFDAPTSDQALPQESACAVNDSGAGIFTVGPDGSLELAGLAVSVVTTWGQSDYGSWSLGINLSLYTDWLYDYITPAPEPAPAPEPEPTPEEPPVAISSTIAPRPPEDASR